MQALSRTHTRRADIQGLRGIAVLAVVAYHANLGLPGGFTGVDVFFVISGFVITNTLLRERRRTGRVSLPGFYLRRMKRLLPALALVIVVVDVVGVLAAPVGAQSVAGHTGIWSSFFLGNAYLYGLGTGYFDVSASLDPFLHLWTLAVEEQFYVVFSLLLVIAWRLRGRRAAAAATAAISTLSFALAVLLSHGALVDAAHRPQELAFYGSPTRAWEFGLGACLALSAPVAGRLGRSARHAVAILGAACVVASVVGLRGTSGFPSTAALLPTLGACALIAAGTDGQTPLLRVLAWRPLAWIGDRSYSWYLWHWPAIVYARALLPGVDWAAAAAAVLSLAPAIASFRWVEEPFRRDPSIRGRRAVRAATVLVLVPAGASLALVATGYWLGRAPALRAWAASRASHLDAARGCEGASVVLGSARCRWMETNARGTVALVGDSNAGHFSEAVVAAASATGYDAEISTFYGCPLVRVRVLGSSAGEGPCRAYVRQTVAALTRLRPSLVFIAARDDDYLEPPLRLEAWSGRPGTARTRTALWEGGLASVLRTLANAGVPAVVVEPVPRLPQPQECAVVLVLVGNCAGTADHESVDAELRPALAAERAAVEHVDSAHLLDVKNAFCSATRCTNMRNGRFLYRDSDHLSVSGSEAISSWFRHAIEAYARAG